MTSKPGGPLRRYASILKGEVLPSFLETRKAAWDHGNLLGGKVLQAQELGAECQLCEHRCRARRDQGQVGKCGVGRTKVATHFVHYGEERPLVPSYTIFFTGCNLRCVYCQNWDISTDPDAGKEVPPKTMARTIEARGLVAPGAPACRGIRNVNWVGGDPIPHLAYVLQVLMELNMPVPQVWNSNMYMTREALSILDGTMDVYLTDLKYGNDRCARELSAAPRYWEVVTRNHLQAALQGELLVRHLMLPGHLECCTYPVLQWIADNLPEAGVNLMDQYRPEHRALSYPGLDRGISRRDHDSAFKFAKELGLTLF